MKREDILSMQAGRDLDALVAEKVMGWKQCNVEGTAKRAYGKPSDFRDHEPRVRISDYSTDISAAWKVVEKMQQTPCKDGDHYVFRIEGITGFHKATFYHHLAGSPADDGTMEYFEADADTAPLAICRAALLAVMEL